MHGTAVLEQLDPRVKLLTLALLSLQTVTAQSPATVLLVSLMTIAGCAMAHVRPSEVLRRVRKLTVFLAAILLFNLLTTSGDILFSLGELYATREGLATGLRLSFQLIVLAILAMLFVRTTSIETMLDALDSSARRRDKFVRSLSQVSKIALNFVPILIRDARQIKSAQLAYGAAREGGFISQARFAASASVPLFVKAYRSAHQLALAMDSRCYVPGCERTNFAMRPLRRPDWVWAGAMVAECVLSLLLPG